MKHVRTGSKRGEFDVLVESREVQAAKMTLQPGGVSDEEPSNEHRQSEQWLFVIAGTGELTVGKTHKSLRRVKIQRHSLVLIEKGELHQIKNTGRRPLSTINFYAPPAY